MKKILIILICNLQFVICNFLCSEQLVERTLTLKESIDMAISNSQPLLSADLDMKIAGQRLKEARSIMFPQLEFNANYSRFEAESPLLLSPPLGNTILPQKISAETDEIENYYTTKISLSQIIWRGAKFSATKKFANAALEAAKSDYTVIKNKAIFLTKKAFYRLLAIKKKIDICNETMELLMKEKPQGLNSKNRFIAERILSRINNKKQEIEKEFEIAKINYLEAIGIEFNTIFTIKGELKYEKVSADLNKCLAWAMEYRTELKKTELQEQMDALSLNLSVSGRYPTIAVGGNYQVEDKEWPFEKKSWNATINLTYPLFDGFAQFARIKQKKYQLRQAQIRRANIADSIKAQVRKSFIEYEHAIKHFEQKDKEMESISSDKRTIFKNLSYLEYIEISEIIMNSELEYVDIIKDVIIAKSDLENAIGRSLE
ncbi:MAG: TolC family protein [Elusimicrobia bacterium]|nr:TolC family protein [Elusimicrobiota bacterium]